MTVTERAERVIAIIKTIRHSHHQYNHTSLHSSQPHFGISYHGHKVEPPSVSLQDAPKHAHHAEETRCLNTDAALMSGKSYGNTNVRAGAGALQVPV